MMTPTSALSGNAGDGSQCKIIQKRNTDIGERTFKDSRDAILKGGRILWRAYMTDDMRQSLLLFGFVFVTAWADDEEIAWPSIRNVDVTKPRVNCNPSNDDGSVTQ